MTSEYSDTLTLEWRSMVSSDRPYVLMSWLRSYCMSPEMRGLPAPVYFELYTPVVERLVRDSTVMVAHDPELPDVVVGFRVMAGDLLHYAFTKRSFRQLGVAKWMLKDLPDDVRYTPEAWHFGQRLVRAGWARDAMARWRT